MIDRYSRQPMRAIWEPEYKFRKWLEIELAACFAHVQHGTISQTDYDTICNSANFDVERINQIEAEVNHDVIAFLTSVAEFVGPASRYIHLGLTSSDVVDTALSMLLVEAGNLLLTDIDNLMAALKNQALAHKHTMMMGRTHGVHAEPMPFGLKLTIWYEEMKRNRKRLTDAVHVISVGKISGAVGNYAHMSPELERIICEKLGLAASPASSQILQRDRHADFVTTLAIIAGTMEKMATEIRALQKTEFNEVMEPFSSKQKGSSAMPHKRNPILCERVTGLARTIRGNALTALENQALWHERDISHSSAERVILPDATIALNYMFELMTRIISNMVVNPDSMMDNIAKSYNVFYSQQLLLKLVDKGMLREDAYRIVQRHAIDAFTTKTDFKEKIVNDPEIQKAATPRELNEVFNFNKYSDHIDYIYNRVYN